MNTKIKKSRMTKSEKSFYRANVNLWLENKLPKDLDEKMMKLHLTKTY
jgi:hypothetical protein